MNKVGPVTFTIFTKLKATAIAALHRPESLLGFATMKMTSIALAMLIIAMVSSRIDIYTDKAVMEKC